MNDSSSNSAPQLSSLPTWTDSQLVGSQSSRNQMFTLPLPHCLFTQAAGATGGQSQSQATTRVREEKGDVLKSSQSDQDRSDIESKRLLPGNATQPASINRCLGFNSLIS